MAVRENRFKNMYKTRNKTSTDEIVDQLYEEETKQVEQPAPHDVIVQAKKVEEEPVQNDEIEVVEVPKESNAQPVVKEKKKVGRPRKTEEERNIFNVKLTVSEKEMLTIAATAKGKSRVDYLVGLIKADYKANEAYYESVRANINSD